MKKNLVYQNASEMVLDGPLHIPFTVVVVLSRIGVLMCSYVSVNGIQWSKV